MQDCLVNWQQTVLREGSVQNITRGDGNSAQAGIVVHESFRLGDLIYLGAILAAIRDQAPLVPISVIVSGLGRDFPFFGSINVQQIHLAVPWEETGWLRTPIRTLTALPRAAARLRQIVGRSLLVDARGDIRHIGVAALAGRRTLSSLSLISWDRIRGVPSRHIFIERTELLWQLQDHLRLPRTSPKWPWIPLPRRAASDSSLPRTVVLAPGASAKLRRWDSKNWEYLASVLRGEGFRCISIREPGGQISSLSTTHDAWSGSIEQLGSCLASADLVVAVDSFVGHLAAAVGTPTLTLFGPQLPHLWRPWGGWARHVIAEPFSCRPCDQKRCVRPGASCMDLLSAREVARATLEHLSDLSRSARSESMG